jgi:hypothetical protein
LLIHKITLKEDGMRTLVKLSIAAISLLAVSAILVRLPLLGRVITPKPPFRPVADVRLLMDSMIDPAADVGWNAVATIITSAGIEERAPKDDSEWTVVRNSAVILMESGNLLMMQPRAKDNREWMKTSQGLVDAGAQVLKAAEAQDAAALFASGEVVDNACEACHRIYLYPLVAK